MQEKYKANVIGIMESATEPIYTHSIQIPDTIPSSLETVEYIKIRYVLKVYINNREKLKFPIAIGDYYRNEGEQ